MPFAELTVHTHTRTPLTCAWVLPRGRASTRHLGHVLGHFSPGSVTLTPMGWGALTPTNSRLQILSHPPASLLSSLSPTLGWGAATPFLFRLWLRGCSWGWGTPHPPQVPPVLQAWSLTLFFSLFLSFPLSGSLSSISGSPSSHGSPFSWFTFSCPSFLPAPSFHLCSGSRILAVWP